MRAARFARALLLAWWCELRRGRAHLSPDRVLFDPVKMVCVVPARLPDDLVAQLEHDKRLAESVTPAKVVWA